MVSGELGPVESGAWRMAAVPFLSEVKTEDTAAVHAGYIAST
jgi:hypothetical protein